MNCQEGKALILVVEDDASLRRLVVRMLSAGGFAAVATGRAAGALELVRQRHGAFDLAIVDIVMPGMGGLDLAGELGREYPDLTILYISGYVDSVVADVLSRRSPELMLFKPFSAETLLERVRALLKSPARREAARAAHSAPQIHDGTLG